MPGITDDVDNTSKGKKGKGKGGSKTGKSGKAAAAEAAAAQAKAAAEARDKTTAASEIKRRREKKSGIAVTYRGFKEQVRVCG